MEKTILYPIIAEILMYSIMAIVRIPFGRLAIALSIGLYFVIILFLTCIFENKRNEYLKNNKNIKQEG